MAYIYKLDTNWVSSALMPLDIVMTNSNIDISSSSVNIFIGNDIALGLNIGSSRIAYKHNNIRFKTAKVSNNGKNITYVTRPSILRGFVGWEDGFSSASIVNDLLGINITDGPDSVSVTIDSGLKTLTFSTGLVFSWDQGGLTVDGQSVSGSTMLTATDGDVSVEYSPDGVLRRLTGDFSDINMIEYNAPQDPYDLSYAHIDWDNGVYEDVEIVIDHEDIVVDEYGHQYYRVPDYQFVVSASAIWFPGESKEYLPNDQFSFVIPDSSGDGFAEFSKDRMRAAINTATLYDDGLIRCSVKTYIGYAKVYSSYVYVDYYYIKQDQSDDECAMLEDSVSYGRACRLKITNSAITMSNKSSDIATIELNPSAQQFAHDVYDKMRFGAGCFSSNYKMYYYRDKRNRIEAVFNRESSSKYIKVLIEDQPTRYRATITVKSGTKTTTSTKNFARYSNSPVWNLGNTASINIPLKKAIDNVSDTDETLFTNSAITMDPDTIKILTRTLYINILSLLAEFPQMNLTYSTLGVVANTDADGNIGFIQIVFQPATGAIYGKIADGNSYIYVERSALTDMLNEINETYEFSLTCNMSQLIYEDLNGVQRVFPFSNSTMIIAEIVNGSTGMFYRLYYKNADSYGFVNAKTYKIEE
jgi:hypothetical protein